MHSFLNRAFPRNRVLPRARAEVLSLWITLAILAVVSVIGLVTTTRAVDTLAWTHHTYEVLDTLLDLRSAFATIRSGRDPGVAGGAAGEISSPRVQLYNDAKIRLYNDLAQARQLTVDNPRQQKNLDRLATALPAEVARLELGAARDATTREDLAVEPGAVRVRSLIVEALNEERGLLALRKQATINSVQATRVIQAAGMLVSFLLLVDAFRRLRQESTLRYQSDLARRESEQSLATLHSIGDGVIATDVNGHVVRMNEIAERLAGLTFSEARGKPLEQVFRTLTEHTRESAISLVDGPLKAKPGGAVMERVLLVSADGVERSIASCAAPIRDSEGKLQGAVVVFRDMTTERQAEQELRDAHGFLDSIVENMPSMVFVKESGSLRFTLMNSAGERLLGIRREQVIGKSDLDLFPLDQAQSLQSKDRAVLEGTSLVEILEEPTDTPSGQRWLRTKKIPIRDSSGEARYLLGISEDITAQRELARQQQRNQDELELRVVERTVELVRANETLAREIGERKQAEQALKTTEEQFRQSQKMEAIGRLAGGIAHDFNNLLSVILSYSEMRSEDLPLGDPLRADLDDIHEAGQRAADLTRQLLAFSRQQVLAPRVLDLNEVIVNMEKMLRRLIGEDIELRTVKTPGIGWVRVDPGQIEQVIMNLVVNARDAMPRGGSLTIETSDIMLDEIYAAEHVDVKPGPHVMVAVTDTGSGMSRATQTRIFEPFFTTKEIGKGTGLGLSTVFGIVKQSGGHLWVYSEIGRGTTFKVYLPRTQNEGQSVSMRARTPVPQGTETVLLVEDEERVRVLALHILKRCGYRALDAKDAADAVAVARRHQGPIHLLLTDLVMPKRSGRELAEDLAHSRPEMKVLFMSGYTDDTVVHHGVLDAGFAFLQKPLTPETLARKVRQVLDGVPN